MVIIVEKEQHRDTKIFALSRVKINNREMCFPLLTLPQHQLPFLTFRS